MLRAAKANPTAVQVPRQRNRPRSNASVFGRQWGTGTNVTCMSSVRAPVDNKLVFPSGSMELLEVQRSHGIYTLTAENYHPFLEEARGTLVVVDFFAEWCGPCKMIYPAVEQMAKDYTDVIFAKVDCGKNERRFLSGLGIRALPTFFLYKGNQKVGEMVGGTAKSLNALVCTHRA